MREKNRAAKLESEPKNAAARRALRFQPRKFPLSVTPRPILRSANKTLYDLALDVITPWKFKDYPGRERAWIQIAAQLPWVLKDTRHKGRPYDLATLERLHAAVMARATLATATLDALAAEIERLKATPPKRSGFCVVDSVTGHDGRYRGSKRRRKTA